MIKVIFTVKFIQAAISGSHPQNTGMIFINEGDKVAAQTSGIIGDLPVMGECFGSFVKSVQAPSGSDP